ncbi:MAG: hypothetical protein IH607_03135, partial [Firmicutes bacterium]|nr:hypothetical protein [Bacillota bacterium]
MSDPVVAPTLIRGAAVVLPDGIRRCELGMRSGIIEYIGDAPGAYDTTIDAAGCTVIPGMIDMHTHGAVRADVNTADAHGFQTLSAFYASEGVTGFFPTLVCDAEPKLLAAIGRIKQARDTVRCAKILGCHLEGPFLAPDFRGSMPRKFLAPGDAAMVARFLTAAEGMTLRMTVSPEADGVE